MKYPFQHFRDLLSKYPYQIRYVVNRKQIQAMVDDVEALLRTTEAVARLNYDNPVLSDREQTEHRTPFTD